MAEPPPIDEDVLCDGDVSEMDGKSLAKPQIENAVLSRLEQQAQDIKSLKAALLEQKELYREVLSELAAEKGKNKTLADSLAELQGARTEVTLPSVKQSTESSADSSSGGRAEPLAATENVRLSERLRAYEAEIRSLRDDAKAWDEAAALNQSKIEQLQLELASTADGKENAMKVLQQATRQVKQLEEELAQRKGVPLIGGSSQNLKRACSYSMSQLDDLVAEVEALRMNLDVAQRNLRETERLRELDARVIEQMRVECDRLTVLAATKPAEPDGIKPAARAGMEGAQHPPLSLQLLATQLSCTTVGRPDEVKGGIVDARIEGCILGQSEKTIAEGSATPPRVCLTDISHVLREVQVAASHNLGAEVTPGYDLAQGPSAVSVVGARWEGEVGIEQQGHSTSILITS